MLSSTCRDFPACTEHRTIPRDNEGRNSAIQTDCSILVSVPFAVVCHIVRTTQKSKELEWKRWCCCKSRPTCVVCVCLFAWFVLCMLPSQSEVVTLCTHNLYLRALSVSGSLYIISIVCVWWSLVVADICRRTLDDKLCFELFIECLLFSSARAFEMQHDIIFTKRNSRVVSF
jgi:hypothetical protein